MRRDDSSSRRVHGVRPFLHYELAISGGCGRGGCHGDSDCKSFSCFLKPRSLVQQTQLVPFSQRSHVNRFLFVTPFHQHYPWNGNPRVMLILRLTPHSHTHLFLLFDFFEPFDETIPIGQAVHHRVSQHHRQRQS